jgi:adenylate cyclase
MARVEVVVFDRGDNQCTLEFAGPVEVGRQRRASETLYSTYPATEGRSRLVVARTSEDNVGRQHALIEPLAGERVRVTNLSSVQPIYFETPLGPPLAPGEHREVGLPQLIRLGTARVLRLQMPTESDDPTASLAGATLPPGAARSSRFPRLEDTAPPTRVEELVKWFGGVMDLLLGASASSADFYQRAARALVESVDLDAGRVLFLQDGEWKQRECQVAGHSQQCSLRSVSQTLLQKVRLNKRTYYEAPAALSNPPASMAGLDSLVAAPILDRHGEVIGALYGERELALATARPASGPITRLEATLVELLARGVAAGLARLDAEKEAGAAIVRFEQFFTPRLARSLAQTPGWEKPRQTAVTLLFCDICNFSRITKQLTPAEMADWARDVLDLLSRCVLEEEGVLIDYVGDGLMAMWGAPGEQPDHAARACRAALDMLAGLPALNERWQATLSRHGEKTEFLIGINTGVAQVGNIGSQYKFKYGAQGDAVNIASRVQGANKFFKSGLLITEATRREALEHDREFNLRRLGKVRLVNIEDDQELYELVGGGRADWPAWRDEYERALDLFAREEFRPAARILAQWRDLHQEDKTALVLLSRAVNAMVEGVPAHHPVWVLPGK